MGGIPFVPRFMNLNGPLLMCRQADMVQYTANGTGEIGTTGLDPSRTRKLETQKSTDVLNRCNLLNVMIARYRADGKREWAGWIEQFD